MDPPEDFFVTLHSYHSKISRPAQIFSFEISNLKFAILPLILPSMILLFFLCAPLRFSTSLRSISAHRLPGCGPAALRTLYKVSRFLLFYNFLVLHTTVPSSVSPISTCTFVPGNPL